MSENNIYLSIVVPGRNQGRMLAKTLSDIEEHIKKYDFEVEVICVDGHSTDNTPEVLEKFKTRFKYFQILHDGDSGLPKNGKGAGVRAGMIHASGKLRMYLDADSSTPFSEIDKFIPYLEGDYQVVMGSRYISKPRPATNNAFKAFWKAFKEVMELVFTGKTKSNITEEKQPWFRQFMSRGGNLAFATILGISVADSRCGFKAYTGEAADKIFPYIKIHGFGFEEEVLILAKKNGYKIIEIPVLWYNDKEDTNISPLKDSLKSFIEIFKVKWYKLSGKYRASKA